MHTSKQYPERSGRPPLHGARASALAYDSNHHGVRCRSYHLSDGELMRRMTDLRAMGAGAPATTMDEWEEEEESEDVGQTEESEDETEHECGDVRKRMAEVIEGMSDEEIAESLRRSGRLGGRAKPKAARTPNAEGASTSTSMEDPEDRRQATGEGGQRTGRNQRPLEGGTTNGGCGCPELTDTR